VAICHVGWRGAKEKIFVKVLQKMVTNFNSDLSDILIAVGPGIRACCYKHKNLVQQQDNLWQPFIKKGKEGLISIDIPGFILKNLKKAGIRQKNIEISDICTCCSGNFFSHFRSLKTGEPEKRFAAIIGINNEKN